MCREFFRGSTQREAARRAEKAIVQVTGEHPMYGTRRVSAQLRRPPHELVVNRKQAQRVMRERNLLAKARQYKTKTTDSRHTDFPNLSSTRLCARLPAQPALKFWGQRVTLITIVA